MTTLETFISELYDSTTVTEQIHPAAVLAEEPGHVVIMGLSAIDVRHNGVWDTSTGSWTRYDQPWHSAHDPGDAVAVGAVHVTYGVPSRYDITLYRAEHHRARRRARVDRAGARRRGAASGVPHAGDHPARRAQGGPAAVPLLSSRSAAIRRCRRR